MQKAISDKQSINFLLQFFELQKRWVPIFLLFLFALGSNSVFSQQKCEQRFDWKYIGSYWKSGLTIVGQPLHYKVKDWAIIGGTAVAVGLFYTFDEEIYSFFDEQLDLLHTQQTSQYTDVFGNGIVTLPLLTAMYITSAVNDDCCLRAASLAGLQAFAFSAVGAIVLKELTQRQRPNQEFDAKKWHGPFSGHSNSSFPSGHTMRSFAVATVLAGMYPDHVWVGLAAYTLSGITAFGRVVSQEHWTSDVLAGAAIGYFVGRGVLAFQKKIEQSKNFSLMPSVNEYGLGIVLGF